MAGAKGIISVHITNKLKTRRGYSNIKVKVLINQIIMQIS